MRQSVEYMPYLLDRVSDIEWSREQMHAIHPRAAALARALRGQAQEANAAQVRFSVLRLFSFFRFSFCCGGSGGWVEYVAHSRALRIRCQAGHVAEGLGIE